MNLLEKFEQDQVKKLSEGKEIPYFKPGDTLKIGSKIKDGDKERIQYFEGVCIARRNRGVSSSVKLRKIANAVGVEKSFSIYSPFTASIEVVKYGKVRRAKLYYLRNLSGKAARIKERINVK